MSGTVESTRYRKAFMETERLELLLALPTNLVRALRKCPSDLCYLVDGNMSCTLRLRQVGCHKPPSILEQSPGLEPTLSLCNIRFVESSGKL